MEGFDCCFLGVVDGGGFMMIDFGEWILFGGW